MSLALHWALQVQYMAKKKESIKRKIKKTEDLPKKKKRVERFPELNLVS